MMNKENTIMFEIQKELLLVKSIIINMLRNKEVHGEYISFDKNILDDIELLQQLIILEADKFTNESHFLSKLIEVKQSINMNIFYKNQNFEKQNSYERNFYGKNSHINMLAKHIDNFIKTSNISKDIISFVKKNIIQDKQLHIFKSRGYIGENSDSLLIQQEFKENLKKLEKQTKESKEEMKKLLEELEVKKTITAKTEQEKQQLEQEKQQLEQEIKEFQEKTKKSEEAKEELNKYKNETEKINRAIDKLRNPATELIVSKEIFENKRDEYNEYAINLFTFAIVIFFMIILNLFLFVGINDIIKSEKNLSLGFYLINIFPILFPTILGFLFIRQSNINSQEVQKINRRFILIHEVNQSLQALVEVNRGKDMDNKTEKVIDKLIENILNYASENNSLNSNNEDMNFIELNESIDRLIDTIDKKITIIKE